MMADNCMEEKLQHGKHETQSNCITSGDHQISNLYINCLVMAALWNRAGHYIFAVVSFFYLLVHGQMTIIFVVSVGLSVCLYVCAEFFSAVFDPISIKLGHMLYVWVYLCPLEYRGCVTSGAG